MMNYHYSPLVASDTNGTILLDTPSWARPTVYISETEAPLNPTEAPFLVHYGVTSIITALVGILFVLVYVQLIMVICFGYKLLTYQTVLLFDILLWAALRLTLYSFYYYHCCESVGKLNGHIIGWFLVAFPSALQYFSLAVLVHYFGESIFKVYGRRLEMSSLAPPYKKMRKYRILGEFLWVISVVAFLAGSVSFYCLINRELFKDRNVVTTLVILRVVLLDGLFLVMSITLGVCIIMIYTTRAGKDVLDARRGRKCGPLFISCLLILFFASRDIYSLAVVISDTSNSIVHGFWTFATDEGDYQFLSKDGHAIKYGYIAYFSVMMIWEVIPTYIIVFFFRVKIPLYHTSFKPCTSRRRGKTINQRHFFENPNRYDENEQLLNHQIQRHSSTTSHVSIPSLTGSNVNLPTPPPPHHHNPYSNYTPINGGYGAASSTQRKQSSKVSINSHHRGNSNPAHSSVMPGTTPPQLFTSPSFFTDR